MPRRGMIVAHYLRHSPGKLAAAARLYLKTKRSFARVDRSRGTRASLPPLVTLQLSARCNLRCRQCGLWGDRGVYHRAGSAPSKGEELSTAQWAQIIDEISAWRPYVSFFGGEPLLRPDVVTLVGHATRRGLPSALTSNMTLLDPTTAAQLVDAGLDYFIASLDGPEPVNNAVRKGNDVYTKVVAGLQALLSARQARRSPLPIVEVCFTLTEQNQHAIADTARLLTGFDIDLFSVQLGMFTTPTQLAATRSRLTGSLGVEPHFWSGFLRDVDAIDPAVVDRELRAVSAMPRHFDFNRYPRFGVKDVTTERYLRSPEAVFGDGACHVPWQRAHIMPDGRLVACPMFPEVVIGKVNMQPLASLWNEASMARFRRSLTQEGLFAACSRCCELYDLDYSKAREGLPDESEDVSSPIVRA